MSRIPRIVPWTSTEEYQQVYEWLYAESPRMQELGVKRVKAWASRGKVPHAVTCTAAFVEVMLRDQHSTEKISLNELCLLYSMVFTRFVNGMVDPAQQGTFALSIATLAAKLDLPLWFVELRHAATHEALPSLQLLRRGSRQAIKWLDDNYWASQKPLIDTQINDIRLLIANYKDLRKQYLKVFLDLKSKETPRLASLLNNKLVKQIQKLTRPDMLGDLLIPVLLESGFLVPKGKRKRATLPDLLLSEELLQLWLPILRSFDETWTNFGSELMQIMLEKLDADFEDEATTSTSYMLTIVAWIHQILKIHLAKKSTSFGDIDLENVLEFCLRRPNSFTYIILEFLTERDVELRSSVVPFLKYIDKTLSLDHDIPKISDEEFRKEILALETQLSEIIIRLKEEKLSDTSNELDERSTSSGWTLYDATSWVPCPIGCLPNGQLPCLDLPLELDEARKLPHF
ncbi:hypothetical protein G9A89_013037 [Geosiphon pyriformis]|nr:hypothetical protein G9A89_013037 [Geosiphon pyriformis]